jgi:alkanesulfonate monooxygenase SsuD/methylene tetrahydromethanopterin reductase-like flavin-dependent oxidoreductase (luciferase family)
MIFEAQIADTSRASEAQVFHECVEQSVFAEQMGFDGIWAVEHTSLVQYAHMSAPESFLAYVAGKTTSLEIGHGVVCLPHSMNHPLKVAERVATLDILTKGRLNFGVGKGGTQQEAGAFGNQLEELQDQVDESMYIIPQMWHEGEFSYESNKTKLKIPPRPIYPKPYQNPHPPMFMACTREHTLNMAGERGLGALVLGFAGPDDVARKNQLYRDAFKRRRLEDQVGDFATEHLSALCPAMVLNDRDQARKVGLRGQRFFSESLAQWYHGGNPPSSADMSEAELLAWLAASRKEVVAAIGEDKLVSSGEYGMQFNADNAYGNVDDAITYVQRLIDAGADEIMFLMQMGTVPHALIIESIRNIGEQVIPHFRKKYGKSTLKKHLTPSKWQGLGA